jgi:uncharacterized protein YgiM (DUF1202 family)
MRKFILPVAILAATLATASTGFAANMMMTVTKDTAIAMQPNANAKNVGTVNAGTQVTVVDDNGQWAHIQSNGMDGFVPSGSLKK